MTLDFLRASGLSRRNTFLNTPWREGSFLLRAAGAGPSQPHKLCIKRGATPRLRIHSLRGARERAGTSRVANHVAPVAGKSPAHPHHFNSCSGVSLGVRPVSQAWVANPAALRVTPPRQGLLFVHHQDALGSPDWLPPRCRSLTDTARYMARTACLTRTSLHTGLWIDPATASLRTTPPKIEYPRKLNGQAHLPLRPSTSPPIPEP